MGTSPRGGSSSIAVEENCGTAGTALGGDTDGGSSSAKSFHESTKMAVENFAGVLCRVLTVLFQLGSGRVPETESAKKGVSSETTALFG